MPLTTTTTTTPRVRVTDGWVVKDNPDGSQTRARLIHDPHHPEPDRGRGMWNEGVSLVRERDGYGGADLDEHEGLTRVLNRTDDADTATMVYQDEYGEHDVTGEAKCDRVTFVRRYLRAFHGVQHVSLLRHQGYSKGDWADIWVIAEDCPNSTDAEATARATFDEWDAWAKGDCYGIESETRTLLDSMAGDDEDGWVEEDPACFGYYGDDAAEDVLAEALGVDREDLPPIYDVTERNY